MARSPRAFIATATLHMEWLSWTACAPSVVSSTSLTLPSFLTSGTWPVSS
jgi:hypothetical protein